MRGEVVEVPRFVGFVRHGSAQLRVVDPAQQVNGSEYTPKLSERAVDLVATTIAIEAGQGPGGRDATALDGQSDAQELLPVGLNQRPVDRAVVEMSGCRFQRFVSVTARFVPRIVS